MLRAVVGKMRSVTDLIESSGKMLPTDEVVTGAGVLCRDAGTLLEALCDQRLDERFGEEEKSDG